jgi:pyroglutamyl-peptidase
VSGPAPRVLVTGFGPFPGAPRNPTATLVRRLARRRATVFGDLRLATAVLPVTWDGLPARLGALIDRLQPDALMLFGLAASSTHFRVEMRGAATVNQTLADAAGACHPTGRLGPPAQDRVVGDAGLAVRDALTQIGLPASLSADAGGYLCNAALWQALGTGRPTAFLHVPATDDATILAAGLASLRALADYAAAR